MRAMSLGAEQITVPPEEFEKAKTIVTGIIVRDMLSVRVYESADFAESPTTSLLEVWEQGKRVRKEKYMLFLSE